MGSPPVNHLVATRIHMPVSFGILQPVPQHWHLQVHWEIMLPAFGTSAVSVCTCITLWYITTSIELTIHQVGSDDNIRAYTFLCYGSIFLWMQKPVRSHVLGWGGGGGVPVESTHNCKLFMLWNLYMLYNTIHSIYCMYKLDATCLSV